MAFPLLPVPPAGPLPGYAELQVTTNFSFLEGGSHPEELVATASALGLRAIAITDRNSLAGVVRAHTAVREAGQETGLRLIIGVRLDFMDAASLLAFPRDRAAYGALSRLITLGRRRAPKGECHLGRADLVATLTRTAGILLVLLPPEDPPPTARAGPPPAVGAADPEREVVAWRAAIAGPLYLAASHRYDGQDADRIDRLAALAATHGLGLLATNDVHYHRPERRPLQDVLSCIRHKCTIEQAGWRLARNAERHLKPPAEMARLFTGHPQALANGLAIAEACTFSLDELRYEYPDETLGPGRSPREELEFQTWLGARSRYPEGLPERVEAQLRHELALIAELDYAPYFLTVHDIVRFARGRGIVCQGRGSAANSAVCFVLGITAVDPARVDLLFERFVSAERNEPPDIDVDFEHERREEVIQYIYGKYGRDRAGLTATVICYRARGALREVGKAMGLSVDAAGKLSANLWGSGREAIEEERVREVGLDPGDRRLRQTLILARQILGFPRHLSQHVGGFVISRGPLEELVPIENAAMEDRTVIEWDKDDLDALGILKIDVLGLGMLSCVRRAFDLLADHYGRRLDLATLPAEDPAVYDMLCKADSLGVFQVESRAQMTMLPRLKPRNFYDLVIEVAIVRPGPIQGDMVHPYLRRRNGEEAVSYPSGDLRRVLEKTLGIPLFQEQAMRIAIVGAGFTPSEADKLRRAMATFKKSGDIGKFREKMVGGMIARNYDADFAERCFRQIEGFGTYGFPESHAASFALLVYVSAWIKCHYPDIFACALLNSQPMGFYAPAQIVRDAQEHGVVIAPPDVNISTWDNRLESLPGSTVASPRYALRLGLREVKGLAEEVAGRLVEERQAAGSYDSLRALWRRAGLTPAHLERLAEADAFRSLGLDRRAALWAAKGLGPAPLPLFAGLEVEATEPVAVLPGMGIGEHVCRDYATIGMSLKHHPVALLRDGLDGSGYVRSERLKVLRHGRRVAVAGLVLVRQRPGSAKGVIFITLEDETAVANLVVMPQVFTAFRRVILAARLLGATGRIEKVQSVIHVKVDRLYDLSDRLATLSDPGAQAHLARLVGRTAAPDAGFGAMLAPAPAIVQKARNFR